MEGGRRRIPTQFINVSFAFSSLSSHCPPGGTVGGRRVAGGAAGPHPARGAEVLRALPFRLQHGVGTVGTWAGMRHLETHTAARARTSSLSVRRRAGLAAVTGGGVVSIARPQHRPAAASPGSFFTAVYVQERAAALVTYNYSKP